MLRIFFNITILRKIMSHISLIPILSILVLGTFAVTLFTCYFFPIYPDEIQVRFWLSRLPYDFPLKISGAPTCVSNFTQPIPLTMYVPGVLNWALHGTIESFRALRQVGLIIPFLWIGGLILYFRNKVRNSLMNEGGARSSLHLPHLTGLFVAVFSVGVFPVFLITNRSEQLILPSVVLLISVFLISRRLEKKGQVLKKWGLTVMYFIAVSLALYGHAKGLFLTPFFIIVGWQLFRQFNNRVLFVFLMMLLGLHVIQDYIAWKYAFQCTDAKLGNILKSFSLDPAALFYDPLSFLNKALQSLINVKKYFYQISFQTATDINYLPNLPLGSFAKIANIFIRLNFIILFLTIIVILPLRYYQIDVTRKRILTINAALLVLFICLIISTVFNLPKSWYDAGYFFSLLLIIWIFFLGENFSRVFDSHITRMIYIYLATISLLSQSVFIHRYLPAFLDGYAGPSVPIVSYNHDETFNNIDSVSSLCDIDPVNSKKLIVDDYTYLFLKKSSQPMAITYILFGNDAESSQRFISEVDSDGIIVRCASLPTPYLPFAEKKGNVCCISGNDLNKLPLPF